MSQDKAAEIIDINASRAAAPGQSRVEKAGEFLASARQAAGLGFEAVSAETKVKIEHLEAIEQTRPDKLPALPYAVGFVKVYARFLDLDAEAVAAQFKDDIGAAVLAPIELTPAAAGPQMAPEIGGEVRLASALGILAILIFAGWVAFKILGADNAAIDAGVTENLPPVEPPAVSAPLVETAPQNTEISGEPITEVSGDVAIPAAASFDSPQSTADARSIELSPIPEADAITDLTPSAISSTLEIAAEAAPAVTPAPQNVPAQTKAPARRQVVIASKVTRTVAPVYPNRCGEGAAPVESVTLVFDVTGVGRAANARVVSSTNACFDKSALRTVKRWRFEPKTIDGAAQIDAGKTATLHFRQ